MPSSARIMVSAPPLPSTMPKALVGHRFEIGEHRAAGDVGREIEMHAPGGERRLDMRRTRNSRRARRAARTSSSRAVSSAPAMPFLRQAFQAVPASARTLIGEPSSRNRCSASPGKAATRRRQVSASAARRRRCAATVFSRSVLTPNQRPSGKALAKQSATGANSSPCRFQFICIFPVKGRAGEEAQIHRAEIVPEAGKREFARSGPRRRSSRCARKPRLSSLSAPDARRMPDCCGRPRQVWRRTRSRPRPAIPLCLKIIADAYVFV